MSQNLSFFNLSEEELADLSPEESLEYNRKMLFVLSAGPDEWLESAEELRDCAETLWPDFESTLRVEAWTEVDLVDGELEMQQKSMKASGISRPYLLLAGFALENLIKGALVARDPSHVSSGTLSRALQTHDLVRLVADLGEPTSADEQEFCRVATSAIPSWGRYPIPVKSEKMTPEVAVNEKLRAAFLALFDRVASDLRQGLLKDGWDSGIGYRIDPKAGS